MPAGSSGALRQPFETGSAADRNWRGAGRQKPGSYQRLNDTFSIFFKILFRKLSDLNN